MYTCCTHPDHNSSTSVVLSLSPKILPFTIFSCIDIRHKEILFGYNKLEHYMPQLLCLAVLTAGCITFYLKSHIASGMSAGEWNNRGKTGHLLSWQELWLQSSSPALSLAQGQHKTLQRSGADDKAWLDTALSSVPSFSGQGRGKGWGRVPVPLGSALVPEKYSCFCLCLEIMLVLKSFCVWAHNAGDVTACAAAAFWAQLSLTCTGACKSVPVIKKNKMKE